MFKVTVVDLSGVKVGVLPVFVRLVLTSVGIPSVSFFRVSVEWVTGVWGEGVVLCQLEAGGEALGHVDLAVVFRL